MQNDIIVHNKQLKLASYSVRLLSLTIQIIRPDSVRVYAYI